MRPARRLTAAFLKHQERLADLDRGGGDADAKRDRRRVANQPSGGGGILRVGVIQGGVLGVGTRAGRPDRPDDPGDVGVGDDRAVVDLVDLRPGFLQPGRSDAGPPVAAVVIARRQVKDGAFVDPPVLKPVAGGLRDDRRRRRRVGEHQLGDEEIGGLNRAVTRRVDERELRARTWPRRGR